MGQFFLDALHALRAHDLMGPQEVALGTHTAHKRIGAQLGLEIRRGQNRSRTSEHSRVRNDRGVARVDRSMEMSERREETFGIAGRVFDSCHLQRPQVVELGAELDRRGSEDAARADVPLAEFLPRIADLF